MIHIFRGHVHAVVRPIIIDGSDLRRYVVSVTLLAMALALVVETSIQMAFFTSWENVYRQWVLDIVVSVMTAVPVTLSIGRAHRELYAAKLAVEQLSRTDPLTELPNRRSLFESGRSPASEIAILAIVDIDRFKAVNDTYGHAVGDEVIRLVGQRMAAALRGVAIVGRIGGEEFAAIASEPCAGAFVLALEEVRREFADRTTRIATHEVRVTVSIGIAIRDLTEPFDQLYADADEALYAAKRTGRNRIEPTAKLVARLEERAATLPLAA